jgi:hypothetical protein
MADHEVTPSESAVGTCLLPLGEPRHPRSQRQIVAQRSGSGAPSDRVLGELRLARCVPDREDFSRCDVRRSISRPSSYGETSLGAPVRSWWSARRKKQRGLRQRLAGASPAAPMSLRHRINVA